MRLTHDGAATLDDTGVPQFCKQGFVVLDGVVPEPVNARATACGGVADGAAPASPTNASQRAWTAGADDFGTHVRESSGQQ